MRLFKGFEQYKDLHKFYFDIETTSLKHEDGHIFLIGMKSNRGFRKVLEIDLDNPIESEKKMIIEFFDTIYKLKPHIIAGYNSEAFDFYYILGRAQSLGIDFGSKDEDGNMEYDVRTSLHPEKPIKRMPASVKFGGETENYEKTVMWGFNVIDIAHAVRATKAINSEIKGWGLKYITKYAKANKGNRMYVDGDKIYSTWRDNKFFFVNTSNNAYSVIPSKFQDNPQEYIDKIVNWVYSLENMDEAGRNSAHPSIKRLYDMFDGDYKNVGLLTGKEIVSQYLLDDLDETEVVDEKFGQSNFMIGKTVPTDYVRATTMGNSSKWKMLLYAYHHMHKVAVPVSVPKRDIVGGLSRLLELGYARNVLKMDFSSLYPSIQLTHDVFPSFDITGVLKEMLTYFRNSRNENKALSKKYAKMFEESGNPEHDMLAKLFDTKQLPVKILNNSQFGAISAPNIFNWGDNNIGCEITCTGRQYLRLMVWHFGKYGFKALVGDSVTWDTPIYIKDENSMIDIIPIHETIIDENVIIDENGGERDFSSKKYQVLTVNGWKDMKYSYRHGTDKKIHRVTTKDRLVNVTSDHSLFQNGVEVKPKDLKRGDVIDVYELEEKFNTIDTITLKQAYLYGFFLGDGSSNNSPRKSHYKSRKTGLKSDSKGGFRSDWKISNSRKELLLELSNILVEDFKINNINLSDNLSSSSVYNLNVYKKDLCDFFCENFYTSRRMKKVPSFILNATKEIKEAFIEGVCASDGYGDTIEGCVSIGMKSQVVMAGISFLLKDLGIEYKVQTRKDKSNFITLSLKNIKNGRISSFSNKSLKRSNLVWKNEIIDNDDKDSYVYDISTEDGTFIAGIGMVNCHNTDGFNFSIPDNVDSINYIAKDGKKYNGYEAVLEEFNDLYMYGAMKLSLDGLYKATVNLSRKNYIDLNSDGSLKLVGNSIKSSTLPEYIEETINEVVRYLVEGDGKSFIEAYYKKLEMIYNLEVPLIKIASKSKVKEKVSEYIHNQKTKVNKAGKAMPKKAHMELLIEAGLDPDLGSNVYYVNNGTAKSHGDVGHSYLIDEKEFISSPDKTGDYNYKRAVEAFNKRMEIFLVCFSQTVRDTLIVDKPSKRGFYTDAEMELVSGVPISPEDQDCLDTSSWVEGMKNVPLMEMEEREVVFWNQIDKDPRDVFPHYTIDFSREPLLTKEEKVIKKSELNKIKEIFSKKNVTIKDELEYIVDGDLILRYAKVFKPLRDVTNEKTGKVTKEIVEEVLPKISWILCQDISNQRIDLEVLEESFYKDEV